MCVYSPVDALHGSSLQASTLILLLIVISSVVQLVGTKTIACLLFSINHLVWIPYKPIQIDSLGLRPSSINFFEPILIVQGVRLGITHLFGKSQYLVLYFTRQNM